MFMLAASTIFHSYNSLGYWFNDFFLRIDLVGIGVMIFTMTLVLVFTGYHAYTTIRDNVCMGMLAICILNFCLQLTPCYSQDSFEFYRVAIYIIIVVLTLGLAMCWYVYIASEKES